MCDKSTYCASNHYHLVVSDPDGGASKFAQDFNSLLARLTNCRLKRWRCAVFENVPVNICHLVDEEAILQTIAYVASNPVKDGIVRHGIQWTGVRTRPDQLGKPWTIERPKFRFFTPKTKMPHKIELPLAVPEALEHWDPAELQAELEHRIEAAEQQARDDMDAAGRSFIGIKAVTGTRHDKRGTAPQAKGKKARIPHIIAGCNKVRIAAIIALKAFRDAYRAAWKAFAAGERDVEFPFGTYKMATSFAVRCAPPPT